LFDLIEGYFRLNATEWSGVRELLKLLDYVLLRS
jgi:hypothetical protein